MRWALAGYGDLAERRLVSALQSKPRELVAVWGRRPERTSAFARQHGVPNAVTDVERLCVGVDAVYVATPVSSHVAIAEVALRAGCHVLIEKPLSPSLRAAAPLAELAARGGKHVGVAYYRRLDPALSSIRARIVGGELRVQRVEVAFSDAFDPAPDHPKAWRLDPAVAGAGCLADAGSHRLDLLLWFFGMPSTIQARCEGRSPQGAERVAELELNWADGRVAVCRFAWREAATDRLVLHTDRGRLELAPLDAGVLTSFGGVSPERATWPRSSNPHRDLIDDFERSLAAGLPPVCPLADAERVDRVIEAALRSDAQGSATVLL
jgi:predicted dehydrogenase